MARLDPEYPGCCLEDVLVGDASGLAQVRPDAGVLEYHRQLEVGLARSECGCGEGNGRLRDRRHPELGKSVGQGLNMGLLVLLDGGEDVLLTRIRDQAGRVAALIERRLEVLERQCEVEDVPIGALSCRPHAGGAQKLNRSAAADHGAGAVIGGSTAIELLSTTRVWAAAEGSDGDILNFALTLEYLEATFYERGNATSLITDSREKDIFATIQKDEEAHVQALTDTLTKLGVAPVAKPTITFPAATFATRESYLKLAMVFENTGVGAYLGQAGSITNKDILQAAAGIFGVEARHAALIGVISGATPEGGIYKGATETPIAKADVLAAVMPFLGGMPNTGFAPSQQSLTLLPTGLAIAGAAAALVAFRTRGSRKPQQ